MSYVDDDGVSNIESSSMVTDMRVGKQTTTTLEAESGRRVAVGKHVDIEVEASGLIRFSPEAKKTAAIYMIVTISM